MAEKEKIKIENDFINQVLMQVGKNKYSRAISEELYSHILDRVDYYKELGYTDEDSMKMATEDMGSPEDVAVPLNNIHNVRWYKKTSNIVVIILLIIQFIVLLFFADTLQYYPSQKESPSSYNILELIYINYYNFHYIYKDFISLLIFCFNFAVIRYGWKKRSKPILIAEIISLLTQYELYPYQPLFYGIIKTGNNGVCDYVDSIFSYGRILNDEGMLLALSGFFVTFMICCCVYPLVCIFRQERGTVKKEFRRQEKIVNNILAVFLAINIVLMSVGTTIAYVQLESKKEQDALFRETVLDCIIEDGKTYEQVTQELNGLLGVEGNYFEGTMHFETETVYVGITSCLLHYNEYRDDSQCKEYMVQYILPTFYDGDTSYLLPSDIYCDESDFDVVYEGMTFEEFLDTGLHYKSIAFTTDYLYDGYNQVVFKLKNNETKILNFFKNKYVDYDGNYSGKEFNKLLGE